MQPEIIIVPAIFAIPSVVILVRMLLKHKEKMAAMKGVTNSNPMLEARLIRIEEAVETIAVEMERMGEGQRFVTKLLAERAGQLPEAAKNEAAGRVTTPR
jgi:demethoxyubiquinone hydroxylase (CLK1/Coq7/Cat5 family)